MRGIESLIDPLRLLARHKATPSVVTDGLGVRHVHIAFDRTARYDDKRKAEQIRRRFELLLLMQLDVPPGELPRTVQQLVASGRLLVVNGRYVKGEE